MSGQQQYLQLGFAGAFTELKGVSAPETQIPSPSGPS